MSDTICAVSTPPGRGGIAVIRLSGPKATAIADSLWHGRRLSEVTTHTAHLGEILDTDGTVLDRAVATVFRGPRSFTGEDVVEFSVHGSRYIQRAVVNALIAAGARLAQPGEFTRRAFTSGSLDLAQAEAVADIITSESRAAHRIAMTQMRGRYSTRLVELRDRLIELASLLELELDFSEEDVEFASRQHLRAISAEVQSEVLRLSASFKDASAIKDGIPVAIIGSTNAGKSSLLNALLGDDRAIVSDIHGTTRDIVEDTLTLGDYTFRIMDTAGLRDTTDTIESIGISRSLQAARNASIVVVVIDATCPVLPELPETDADFIAVVNKCDLPPAPTLTSVLASPALASMPRIETAAKSGMGLPALTDMLQEIARAKEGDVDALLVTNARHYQALVLAGESMSRAIEALDAGLSGDLIALDIRLTIDHLSSILGQITSQDILSTIFSRFCIGK